MVTRTASVYIAPAVAIVGATANLLRTETTTSGSSIKSPEAEFKALVDEAAQSCSFDRTRLTVEAGALDAKALFDDWIPNGKKVSIGKLYAQAVDTIDNKYQPILIAAKGKPESIPDQNFATAGKNLQTMIASYEALRKTLFTDSGGKLIATLLRKQEKLAD